MSAKLAGERKKALFSGEYYLINGAILFTGDEFISYLSGSTISRFSFRYVGVENNGDKKGRG